MEAILPNNTRKLLWFEITEMLIVLIVVLKTKIIHRRSFWEGAQPANPWSWTIFFFKTQSAYDTYCIPWYIFISKFIAFIIRQVC